MKNGPPEARPSGLPAAAPRKDSQRGDRPSPRRPPGTGRGRATQMKNVALFGRFGSARNTLG
eukprot:8918618-Pyramimonas_sp.AAC.1